MDDEEIVKTPEEDYGIGFHLMQIYIYAGLTALCLLGILVGPQDRVVYVLPILTLFAGALTGKLSNSFHPGKKP